MVDAFLRERPAFRPFPPAGLASTFRGLLDDLGRMRTLPYRAGLDAFFAAAVLKSRNPQ